MGDLTIAATSVLVGAPLVFYGGHHLAYADRKLQTCGSLIAATGSAVLTVGLILADFDFGAYVSAGATAVMLWVWWHSGGGDGLRRLGRKLRSLVPGLGPAPQTT